MKYRNPIIPGFYPDPSVCRVGDDFYLVNSSFEFFPGVPLYHSKDLVDWEEMGYVLTRDSQVPLQRAMTSLGIFAPTIRYHNGRFYMITTNMDVLDEEKGPTKNFIVWTDDINGEWSEPFPVDHMGIDPSLFWDEDGKCYYTGNGFDEAGQGIVVFEINPDTGEKLSETKVVWRGTGGSSPEGPHLYRKDGMYYLMIAEGGTEYGHMETIARSESIWGPYESCPHNPIVSHRDFSPSFGAMSDPDYVDIRCVGHADMVDDPEGNWWLVLHGVRPSERQLHHIGRETMLVPMKWVDGWPVVNDGEYLSAVMEGPGEAKETLPDGMAKQNDFTFCEDFTKETKLPVRWSWLRNPVRENYQFDNGLLLRAGADTLDGMLGFPTFVGVRQRQMIAEAETIVDFNPESEQAQAGITVFHTRDRHYDLMITRRDGKRAAVLYRVASDLAAETAPVFLPEEGPVTLRIVADKMKYEFYANGEKVGQGSTQLLSTEAMAGTFTGCFFGIFCQGEEGAQAKFTTFSVK